MYTIEHQLHEQGWIHIVGTDEVGRGPMAGPLVVAAVILPHEPMIEGLKDSKQLSAKQREMLYELIHQHAIEIQVCFVDVKQVDQMNVYQASKWAMQTCIQAMKTKVDYILTDAMPLEIDIPSQSIIKGDQQSASIAAASIIAKVERDRYMITLDQIYPQYGFKRHKGYVTKEHLHAIASYGITEHHRISFAPIKRIIYEQLQMQLKEEI